MVSASRVIAASPEAIFDLLADPDQHHVIDGSGTVQAARSGNPTRLTLGAKFGMDMKMGVPYKITNEVVELEENRRIAWRHFGHHIWRYELEPVEGGTKVTESFDWAIPASPRSTSGWATPPSTRATWPAPWPASTPISPAAPRTEGTVRVSGSG